MICYNLCCDVIQHVVWVCELLMASLVDYEDSDSETDQDLQLYPDEAVIISSSSSSSSAAQSGSSGSMKRVQLQASAVRPVCS